MNMNELNTLSSRPATGSRNAVLIAGGLALAGAGLAAGLLLRSPTASAPAAPVTPVAVTPAEVPTPAPSAPTTNAATAPEPAVQAAPAPAPRHASAKPVPRHVAAGPTGSTDPGFDASGNASRNVDTRDVPPPPVAVCSTCGVIESVQAVQHKGKGTGLGAVAGGVLGGIVGHQLGGGGGKTAITVLGALGGGLAGNEVEKRTRAETVYNVAVRMDDGSVRNVTQARAPVVGSRVTVDAQGLHSSAGGTTNSAQ